MNINEYLVIVLGPMDKCYGENYAEVNGMQSDF